MAIINLSQTDLVLSLDTPLDQKCTKYNTFKITCQCHTPSAQLRILVHMSGMAPTAGKMIIIICHYNANGIFFTVFDK